MQKRVLFLVLCLVASVFSLSFFKPVKATTDTWQVGASSDDIAVYEDEASHPPWNWSHLTGNSIMGGRPPAASGYYYGAGLRFLNITIPSGATIESAYLQVRASSSQSGTTVNLRVACEDADNATTFTNVIDYNGRARTSYVDWLNVSSWTAGQWYNSPDISSCIQTVIDRGSWVSGNSVVVFWEDDGTSSADAGRIGDSYDANPDRAAKLQVTYSINEAPTIGSFSGPSTVYANKYVYLNATISDNNGVADFANATVELNGSLILKWDNASDVFSESQDSNNYCTLDAGNSVKTTVNSSSYELSWKVKFHWNYSEGSIFVLAANTIVFDDAGENGTGVETSLFTFEDDLIVHTDAAVDDDHVDPGATITFSGTLYYEGTSTVPEDVTGITAYAELSGIEKGNDTDCTGGSFSITFSAESSVTSYSYNIYAVTDQNTVTNQTVAVIVDKAKIISGGIYSSYLHAGENTTVHYVLQYEYDLANITDGSVTLNGSDMTYVAARYRWEINITESTGGDVVFQIDSVSGNTHGITALNDVAGSQNCTFYVNVNFKTVDYDGNTLTSVTVSICNGSVTISGDGTDGCGMAVVGGQWFSTVVSSGGWANYTGITNTSIQVYASWYGLIVNSTFTLSTTTDQTIDLSCLCYPFIPDAVRYHVASDATISAVTWSVLTHILAVEFSSPEDTSSLIVTGAKPTYILNIVYDFDVDYTSYLDVSHYSNATIYISYANWAGPYIQSSDQCVTSASFVGTKLTMSFTGTGIGEVEVYCGSRGAPDETNGFTTTSYASTILTGNYAFASDKTVWLQWSPSSSSGSLGGDTSTPLLINIDASLTSAAFLGKTANGLLTITWTGATSINIWSISLGGSYQDWVVQIEGLPLTLAKQKLDVAEGHAQVPFILTVPSNTTSGKHHVPLSTLFGLATGDTKMMGSSLTVDLGSYSPTPVPNIMVYIFLAVIGLIVVGGVFGSKKARRHK